MKNFNLQKILGFILLIPPLISVALFLFELFKNFLMMRVHEGMLGNVWSGFVASGGAGFTSALPFYFGLMAIAGAYLIKKDKEKTI